MAVGVIGVVPVVEPFLQLSPATHLQWGQSGQLLLQTVGQGEWFLEDAGCLDDVCEEVADEFVVHRHAGGSGGSVWMRVLRREARANYPVVFLRVAHHDLVEEAGGFHHCGIDFPQELGVAGVEPVLPEMLAHPCRPSGPKSGRCLVNGSRHAPDVGVVVEHPSVCTIHDVGALVSGVADVADE